MATSSVLNNLTLHQIRQAFKKAKSEITLPKGVRLELITEEYYDMALDFTRDNLIREEPINKSLGTEWTDDYKNIWLGYLKHNLSLMLVDEDDNSMIGFRVITIVRYDDQVDLKSIRDKKVRDLLHYITDLNKQADFFGHFGITEAIHFFGLSVNQKYTRRGYAVLMFKFATNMVRHFGINPVYIKTEGSSNVPKKLFEQNGFEALYELPFDDWVVDGRRPIQNTGIHKSMIVYGLKVTQQ